MLHSGIRQFSGRNNGRSIGRRNHQQGVTEQTFLGITDEQSPLL